MINTLEKLTRSCTIALGNDADSLVIEDTGVERIFESGAIIACKYRVDRLIGQGGMGAIYKVEHMQLGKQMALKTIRSPHLSYSTWLRFMLEAKAIARLTHPNIVKVFDFGIVQDTTPFYTMELLEGESLADKLRRSRRLPLGEALSVFVQVADALAHAHRNDIIHRDIKPGNIILLESKHSQPGQYLAKLVDFGIAKLAATIPNADDQRLTTVGTIYGSPLYISPEQSMAQPTDRRSDMYSFACALFEALTGTPPLVGKTAVLTLLLHQKQQPPSLQTAARGAVFPQRLEAVIARLLSKDPKDRYENFEQVADELRLCLCRVSALGLEAQTSGGAVPPPPWLFGQQDDRDKIWQAITSTLFHPAAMAGISILFFLIGGLSYHLCSLRSANVLSTIYGLEVGTTSSADPDPLKRESGQGERVEIGASNSNCFRGDKQTIDGMSTEGTFSKPFLVGWKMNGKVKEKVFKFPSDAAIGTFSFSSAPNSMIICRGMVSVPESAKITFWPAEVFQDHPQILSGFGPAELTGLGFENLFDLSHSHYQAISRLSGLEVLILSGKQVSSADLKELGKLKNLTYLNIGGTSLVGSEIASLDNLSQLEALNVCHLHDLGPLFRFLANHNVKLSHLAADNCCLSAEDCANISKIKTLRFFTAIHSEIDGHCLEAMAPNSTIEYLRLTQNDISYREIKYLHQFSRLQTLALNDALPRFTALQWRHLKQSLPPGCRLNDPDKKKNDLEKN